MSEKREPRASSDSHPKKKGARRKNAKSCVASGLAKGAAIFRKAKRYGALHDLLFHYVQDDHELAVESARLWLWELNMRNTNFWSLLIQTVS